MPNINLVYRSVIQVSIALNILSWISVGSDSISLVHGDEIRPVGANAYQMVTGDDSEEDRKRWDRLFNTGVYVYGKEPAVFLKEYVHLLPTGKVLDLAMGEGRNAVFLAKKGFTVDGVDISEVALRKAKRLAREQKVSIGVTLGDLTHYIIQPDTYQVILNFNYLQRSLIPQVKKGLKKRGVIVYENHTIDQISNPGGASLRQDTLLKKGELKELFSDFEILVYQETNDGKDAKVRMIARKSS